MIRGFNGKIPKIAKSVFVSEAAYVIGDIEIGDNSSVWPGAVIRADFAKIKIGSNSKVEDGTVVHSAVPMEIGDNVTFGHSVVMHGSRVGNNTLIGNNATILDNVEIGSFCIIGAGSLVSQGMKILDFSFVVGVPAEVKGKVSPEQLERLQGSSSAYAELARQYKEHGL
ncbi:gamma carbonic anhydrase family protein [Chloroflexota bacterium]